MEYNAGIVNNVRLFLYKKSPGGDNKMRSKRGRFEQQNIQQNNASKS